MEAEGLVYIFSYCLDGVLFSSLGYESMDTSTTKKARVHVANSSYSLSTTKKGSRSLSVPIDTHVSTLALFPPSFPTRSHKQFANHREATSPPTSPLEARFLKHTIYTCYTLSGLIPTIGIITPYPAVCGLDISHMPSGGQRGGTTCA